MRIITGTARGMRLDVPGGALRPTMDRVREAIFSSLGDAVVGARALDLFAGSGSLGIEALSRGASGATFVDSDRRAAECVRRNLDRARLTGEILIMGASQYLGMAQGNHSVFDLIFADPPYARPGMDPAAEVAVHPGLAAALAPQGTVILECAAPPREIHPALRMLRDRRYGKSRVLFLTHSVE